MESFGRRELLAKAARLAVAAGAVGAWPGLVASATAGGGPLGELAREFEGDVVTRSSPRYARARLLYNTRFDKFRPLAVAYPVSVADVRTAVRWARRHGVRMVPRSGGHSYGGYSTTTGVVLDLSRLARIQVRPNGTARIGGGALLIDVYDRLAKRGVAIPAGSCPTVGIGGLALGGGVGYSSRARGLTCDAIEELTIVTADGKARLCAEGENADLFWACRGGGGGNFGVVTDFVLRTHPAGRVSTFLLEWPWENAGAVLSTWQGWAPDAPDRVFSVCNVRGGGGSSPRITVSGQLLGGVTELRSLLQPLLDTGAPTGVRVVSRSWLSSVHYWGACGGSAEACHRADQTPGGTVPRSTFKAKSSFALAPIPTDGLATILRAVEARSADPAAGSGGVLLDSYGGAINRVPKDATAFVHRNARCSLQFYAYWNGDGPAAPSLRWVRDFHAAVRPHVSSFAYQNYIDPDLADWRKAYYGSNFARLVQVKRAVDPSNAFRFRQSIPTHI